MSTGSGHACAVVADGSVQCWGLNDRGQLGNGALGAANQSSPAVTAQLPGQSLAVAAGGKHSCAVVGREVWCWGENTFGQIGDGTSPTNRPVPVRVVMDPTTTPVTPFDSAVGVVAGISHTCAVRTDGTVWCWGDHSVGQLGSAASLGGVSKTPVQVRLGDCSRGCIPGGPLLGVTSLAAGEKHTCALRATGAAYCWGLRDGLGDDIGSNIGFAVPVSLHPPDLVGLAAGGSHTCGVEANGHVLCWGRNGSGQLGTGSTTESMTPVPVPGLGNVSQVTAGRLHTCALLWDGSIRCWGENNRGQLGDGTFADSLVPKNPIPAWAP
jgi:alpha-tubulin suppressor-like RCC1 family protein